MNIQTLLRKTKKALANSHHLFGSRIRICGCCNRLSIIASFSEGEEVKLCLRCLANFRYELLASEMRKLPLHTAGFTVMELDHRSPLIPILSQASTYHRTYYSADDARGSYRLDGSRCEDITQLTFPDNSIDLIVSSDVLEHVPDGPAAFRETYRVLKPGGMHLFTVPTYEKTVKRAEIVGGKISFLIEPEYHSDPLNPAGILAFWDYGKDLDTIFQDSGLKFSIATGPHGKDQRIVWKAEKLR